MQEINQQDAYNRQMAEIANAPVPKPNHRRRTIVLVILVFLFLTIIGLTLFARSRVSRSLVKDGQIQVDAVAPAVEAAQNFMTLLDERKFEQATRLLSPASDQYRPDTLLTDKIVEGSFGSNLSWHGCTHQEQTSYSAQTLQLGGVSYDSVRINFHCRYEDGWPVTVTFHMHRQVARNSQWLFGSSLVSDTGSEGESEGI